MRLGHPKKDELQRMVSTYFKMVAVESQIAAHNPSKVLASL